GFHPPKTIARDDMARAVVERQVKRQDIDLLDQGIQTLDLADLFPGHGRIVYAGIKGEDRRSEATGKNPGRSLSDVAEADAADRFVDQVGRDALPEGVVISRDD